MEEAATSLSFDDIIPATPGTEKPLKKVKAVRKRHPDLKWKCDAEVIPPVESETLMAIKNSMGTLRSKVYVFHSFSALLKYKPKSMPLNNYIKMVGYYKMSRNSIPYIQGYEMSDQKFAIFVDLETLDCLPKINNVIEIFGHLEFQMVVNCNMPILSVHFWINIRDNISSYIEHLTLQNIFLPDAFKTEKETEEVENDTLIDLIQDLSFGIISMGENELCEL